MQNVKYHQTPSGPRLGFEADLHNLEEWAPVVTQVRETVLKYYVVGTNMFDAQLPREVADYAPDQVTVERVCEDCLQAVRAGRLIDFGRWTNHLIKHGGNRGGPLYSRGMIGHPWREPYLFMHSWEGGVSIYVVNPLEADRPDGGDAEIIELQPVVLSGERMLLIGDQAVLLSGTDPADEKQWSKYHCAAIPSIWRFLPGAEAINGPAPPANAAAGNVLDPLMTALLMLSTRGVPRSTVSAPAKLQKARLRNGKAAIPPHDVVDSAGYVSAIDRRRARGRDEAKGGTHASPIGHLRMGHPRVYASGATRWIADTLVNMTDETKASFRRSHYTVKS